MRFHMHVLPTYFPDLDDPFDVYYQHLLQQVELAEELGWECFWSTEHHFILYGGPVPNSAAFLCAAAARTKRIHLGSSISILPLHHPIQIAEDYGMVDVISAGRLEFGIGIGNSPLDYTVYGVPREEARERFEEAREVITKAWSQDRFSHQGKYWSFDGVAVYPRPIQRPHPPFWVAGTSAASLGAAGRNGYSIMTVSHPFRPEQLNPGVEAWREGLKEGGHDPATRFCKIHVRVYVDENAERARAIAEPAIRRYDSISPSGRRTDLPPPNYAELLACGRNVYGTPDQCIEAINATIRNYDFDIFSGAFNFGGIPYHDVVKSVRLFAKEVMPAFAGR